MTHVTLCVGEELTMVRAALCCTVMLSSFLSRAEAGLEGTQPFRVIESLRCLWMSAIPLPPPGFVPCDRDPFSGLYLRGWIYDFSTINKFTSQSFKNTLVTWRYSWNVSVNNIVLIASITSILQWSSSAPVMRKGMVWTEQAPKGLPEIFCLVLCWRVWVFPPFQGSLPWRLSSSIIFMAGGPHVFVEVEESCWEL